MDQGGTARAWHSKAGFLLSLLLPCGLLYGPYALGQLPVGTDHSLMYAPFFARGWDGGPPLWLPGAACGAPLYDNFQAAPLYPPRWPFYLLPPGGWVHFYGPFYFLHYLAAALGMAGFLRRAGLGRVGQWTGTQIFVLGGHMAGRIINPTIFMASCWLPLTALAALEPGRRGFLATLLAAFLVLSTGSPHLIFFAPLLYGAVWLALGRERHWRDALARLLAGLSALLLAAPAFLPALLRSRESLRTLADIGGNLSDSLRWGEIPATLLGGTGGAVYPEYIDKCLYVGPLVLAGLFSSALCWRRFRDPRFLLGLGLVLGGLAWALGRHLGWQWVLPRLPLLRELAGPSRALVLSALGLALLGGLAADAMAGLGPRASRRAALLLLATAFASGLVFALRLQARGVSPWVALRGYLLAPGVLGGGLYPWLEGCLWLGAAAVCLLALARRPRLRTTALLFLLLAELLHFAPRVLPPRRGADFFLPPPNVAYLMERQAESPQPFRVAGYDPLRMHDGNFDTIKTLALLAPNLAGLYGLEGIQVFDPLTRLRYARFIEEQAGRPAFNDPLRQVDFKWPAPRLLQQTNLRYLIGDPHALRHSRLPLQLDGRRPVADVETLPSEPLRGWLFVSLSDRALGLPPGTEIARLEVQAREGEFSYPIRLGRETADLRSPNFPERLRHPEFRAESYSRWQSWQLIPEWNYRAKLANYRGVVDFGRDLHVESLRWRLTRPEVLLYVASQAYRLSPREDAPWRLVHGREGAATAVYEYLEASPRAVWLEPEQLDARGRADDEQLCRAGGGGIRWLDRRDKRLSLRAECDRPRILLVRERVAPGWRVRVDGREAPLLAVNGLWRAVRLEAGSHRVDFLLRPSLGRALGLVLAGLLVALVGMGLLRSESA